jgi:chemotaxis response regulator CheB/chemotaxis methyl-accepting protein methylase
MSQNKTNSDSVIDSVVKEVSSIVSDMAGIQLGARQSSMVENRLRSRMLKLGLNEFSDYLGFLKNNLESESQALLSLMTTHHTYFFREFSHFEYLLNNGLDRLIQRARSRGDRKIRIWSAAASRGQEAYSLAMFFDFHLKQTAPDVDFEIFGTDVDPDSIAHAQNGVYKSEELKKSPAMYLNENWAQGKGEIKQFSKIKKHLKAKCKFSTANLLKPESFLASKSFDVIFCRNVFIYFNQEQIRHCTLQMMKALDVNGFLVLGVSESLSGLGLKVDSCGPSVYQHPEVESLVATKVKVGIHKVAATLEPPRPIEVLCVDDSKAIHGLLSKILVKENGFVIKGVAYDGREALNKLKTEKYDIITLDLHMPELDGLGFLQETSNMTRPPVVILSAINRDDTSIAQKALVGGAADYVEKPSLENLAQAGNEIRSKLKTVIAASKKSVSPVASVAKVGSKKKVLIVDDSSTIRQLLTKILSADPDLEVVAAAAKPSEVEGLIEKYRPHVITMDIHMPEMDGVTLLKKIHPKYHIPTVMITSISKHEGPQIITALESGAVDYIQKPQMSDLGEVAQQIRDRVKIAANANVKRQVSSRRVIARSGIDLRRLILMGASTGGTEALRVVLQSLPEKIPPIFIVQHIPPVFSAAFAARLNSLCPFEVREAVHGDEVLPNRVLIAPGGTQMGFRLLKDKAIVTVTDEAPMNRHKPSVDYLFKSAADNNITKSVAVILTGMGADGARMMKRLRDSGAHTIAQNKETCVVYGMPREAVECGAAEFQLPLEEIGQKMIDLCAVVNLKKVA